jgi:glutamate synthase (NADPH/NADH) large chain
MTTHGLPPAHGMYDPQFEHDACGVGFLANITGVKSHGIIKRGISVLCNLHHRGAVGADPLDGDGAGIMIQIPDALYRAVVSFQLPATGEYGTGLVFLSKGSDKEASACIAEVEKAVAHHGLKLLGWRDVPTDNKTLGKVAKGSEPMVKQVFIGRGTTQVDQFELKLLLARKRAENAIRTGKLNGNALFYINSLSASTIIYKGMFLAHTLNEYFLDLNDERAVSAIALVHQRYSTNTFPTCCLLYTSDAADDM